MGNKDIIRITSIAITVVILLAGAAMTFWIYTLIYSAPPAGIESKSAKMQIDTAKLTAIQAPAADTKTPSQEGFGRLNPFAPYK